MKFFLLLFLFFPASSDIPNRIKELKVHINGQKPGDTQQVKALLELSALYSFEQLDSAAVYAETAYMSARKLEDRGLIACSLLRKAGLSVINDQEKEARRLLKEAEKLLQSAPDPELEALLHEYWGRTLRKQPDSSLIHYQKSVDIAEKEGLAEQVARSRIRILLILLHQKRHQEFSEQLNFLIPELEKRGDNDGLAETYTYMSLAFRDLNEEDKSLLYAEKALGLVRQSKNKRLKAHVLGAIGSGVTGYFGTSREAEPLIMESLELAVQANDQPFVRNTHKRRALLYFNDDQFEKAAQVIDSLLVGSADPDVFKLKGQLLSRRKAFREAEKYYNKAYELYERDGAFVQQKMILQYKIDDKLEAIGDKGLIRDFGLLEDVTEVLHNADSKGQFFELETRYRTAEKEAELRKKELDLAELRTRNLLITGAALILLLSGVFGIWFLRNRQKRRELEYNNSILALRNTLSVRELESLNSQLNPHEIKNLITSIAPELISKAPDAYRKMIKLFNVTRASLSDQLTESLSDQIEQIEDYLHLQQSISPYSWTFEINTEVTDADSIELPRLLLKNMVENAVKYGMKSREGEGRIEVNVEKTQDELRIEVKDNGKGIVQKQEDGASGKGISTYQRLFDLMNRKNSRAASLRLERIGPWTVAGVTLPLGYSYR